MSRIAEVLAALREKRQDLLNEVSQIDRAIAAIEEVVRTGTLDDDAAGTRTVEATTTQYPPDQLGRQPGPYSMLSICEGAALYLAEVGEPKTSREIAAALRAGGFPSTSKYFTEIVQKMLRSSGSRHGIRRDRKGWLVKR